MLGKIRKIANTDVCKAFFLEVSLLEASQPYFEPATGHFEIREKIALRHGSELDSVLSLKKADGQVSQK